MVDPDNGENIAGKTGNLGINAGDAAAVYVELCFLLLRTVERNRRWSNNSTGIYACEYDELLYYTKSICDGEIGGDFKLVNNHSYRLLYIQLDVSTFKTILSQFGI